MLDFFFNGTAVGYFRGESFPQSAGRHQYEPYRGAGHYAMQVSLKAGSMTRCYYDTDGVRTTFVVRTCPEYGVLQLDDFEISSKMQPEMR